MASRYPRTSESTESSEYESSDDDETIHLLEILVEGLYAGAVIGTKGSNIRRMQRKSDATILLSDGPASDADDTLVSISGTLESIKKALSMLASTVSKYSDSEDVTFKVIVHRSQCGRIIGSGGHQKRRIENSTGASLFVSPDEMSNREKRKVVVVGDSESAAECIIEVLKIMTLCPATESSSSGVVQSSLASPASQGSTSSRRVTRNPTTFSGQPTSTSSTHSARSNTAGHSASASTSHVEATSSMDCRAFAELVTSEMQKISTRHQSQLRDEILASIAKFKKSDADSRLTDDCSICLEKVRHKSFISGCLHVFCFRCICKWIKMKSTCPICVREIKSVLYNIRSNDDYDIYKLPRSQTKNDQGGS